MDCIVLFAEYIGGIRIVLKYLVFWKYLKSYKSNFRTTKM